MDQKVIIGNLGYRLHPETILSHLQIFCPICMLEIVFRDSSPCPKQLSLFCLLRLISTSADRIAYITNLYSMMELLHELKNSSFNIEAFRH